MGGFFISPLVDVNEIDMTTTIPAVATSIAVNVIRRAYKGQEKKIMFDSGSDSFIRRYGAPTKHPECYKDMHSSLGYLKYGQKHFSTRVLPPSATFAGSDLDPSGEWMPHSQNTALKLIDFQSEDADEYAEEFGDDISATDSPLWVIANSRGDWGNNIRIAVCDKTTYEDIQSGNESMYSSTIDPDKTTMGVFKSIDTPLVDDTDFVMVVQEKDRGSPIYATKEVWNISTDEDAVDDQGNTKFAETVINEESDLIRVVMNEDQKNAPFTHFNDQFSNLGGGYSADDMPLPDAEVMDALSLFRNPEELDVNIFIDGDKSDTVKRNMIEICEHRMDSMALLDCHADHVVFNRGSEATDLRTWRLEEFNQNTSYAAVYGNWLNIYDKYNRKYRWIPSSGYVAGIYANTDNVADPWFAPAGLNRAILTGVRKLAWNPDKGNRDILYKNSINPITSFSGLGKVIWGQKTMLMKPSAFNRINVRRLFMTLEKAISTAAKYFVMEPNTEETRLQMRNMIVPFLKGVQAREGIYDFAVVNDSRVNTPQRIDRQELWTDIYIKPTRAAEFIVLNFIASKTGANFSELIGQRAAGE